MKRVKVILKFIGNNFDFIHFFQQRLVAALKIDRLEVLFPEVLKLNNFFGSPLIFYHSKPQKHLFSENNARAFLLFQLPFSLTVRSFEAIKKLYQVKMQQATFGTSAASYNIMEPRSGPKVYSKR